MPNAPGPALWLIPILAYFFSLYPYDPNELNFPVIETMELEVEYDYVIVGGGSAGSVLAARLSEDPNVTVLLLEAGGQETALSEIPGLVSFLQLSDLDWKYQAEPSTSSCLAMIDNRCKLPRGKVIGGSSSINYMLYVRGNKRDFNLWEAMGNKGWGYSHVLPYFKKSENNTNLSLAANTAYHGSEGFLTIGESPWRTPLSKAFLAGAREMGYPIRDFNGEHQYGFMLPQGAMRDGARCSNARAYLRPLRNRTNLHIALHAFVTKILFHPTLKRAYGVVYDRNDERDLEVYAVREVLVSAGAINTPQLLMLSGIGPAKQLNQHNITVIADLPVGKNLMDHVASGPIFVIDQPVSLLLDRLASIPAVYRYITAREGPLATLGGVEGIGFVSSKYINSSKEWPDIEYHFLSGSHGSDRGDFFSSMLGLKEDYYTHFYNYLYYVDQFTIIVKLMRPQSRGYLQLKSADPYEHPKIVPNYLIKRADVLILVDGIKKAVELAMSSPFQKYGVKLFDRVMPGCEKYEMNTDLYWECYIRHLTLTIYHYCGTAKMGPAWDHEAVVDSQLRVYGVSGLRVVDASIFPSIITGNTNAAVTMIAEKVSQMIKDHYATIDPFTMPETPVKQGRTFFVKRNIPSHLDEL